MNNEPVAWMVEIIRKDGVDDSELSFGKNFAEAVSRTTGGKIVPLYTHPSKDLTDEEIIDIADTYNWHKDCAIEFARAILKKASEK